MNTEPTQKKTESLVNILGGTDLEKQVAESWNLQREVTKRYDLPRWEHLTDELRSHHLSIPARLRLNLPAQAAVLAELPQGELSEEEIAAAYDESSPSASRTIWSFGNEQSQTHLRAFARAIYALRPSAPLVIHKTAERRPTDEDGEAVFAWVSNAKPPGWWLRGPGVVNSHPTVYTAWFSIPPAPTPELSEEEQQVDVLKSRLGGVYSPDIAHAVSESWSAAKAYFQQENKEK